MNILANILAALRRFFWATTAESLDALAKVNPEKLDWRHSVVDLLKLTGRDSGLQARKNMARKLGYTGSLDGSAEMNSFLHQKLMEQLR